MVRVISDTSTMYSTEAAREAPDKAETAKDQLLARFPKAEFVICPLTPAFITQGGPACVAVQSIQMR